MTSMFNVENDSFTINVPTQEFTDTTIDGWYISPNKTIAGAMTVIPWSPIQIQNYKESLRRHLLIGRKLMPLYKLLDPSKGWRITDVTPGAILRDGEVVRETEFTWRILLADLLNLIFVINRPADRVKTIKNCTFIGDQSK